MISNILVFLGDSGLFGALPFKAKHAVGGHTLQGALTAWKLKTVI